MELYSPPCPLHSPRCLPFCNRYRLWNLLDSQVMVWMKVHPGWRVCHCGEKLCMAKAELELGLACTVGDNEKSIFKYDCSKRRDGDNIGPLLNEDDHLKNRDTDKVVIVQGGPPAAAQSCPGPK